MIHNRPYQQEALEAISQQFDSVNSTLLVMATATGKCLGRGTPVLMYSGRTRSAEQVRVGDEVMGPDGRPRQVSSVSFGREMMYQVTPTKGDPYTCNESHILSLKITGLGHSRPNRTVSDCRGLRYRQGEIVNISVRNYLDSSKTFRHVAKGYRSGAIRFRNEVEPIVDPYIFGTWLADGHRHHPCVTTPDKEVVMALRGFADLHGLHLVVSGRCGKATTYRFSADYRHAANPLWNAVRRWGLQKYKRIPFEMRTASIPNRLEVLAGIIDGDGHLDSGGYDVISKYSLLAYDIAFVCRSVGLAAYVRKCQKRCVNTDAWGTYYRVFISGHINMIPCRVARKKAKPRQQKKDVLVTGIKVEPIGEGAYYGFTLEGNDRRFLLGDFTVTHNTVTFAQVAAQMMSLGRVMVLAHREELVFQAFRHLHDICGEQPDIEMGQEYHTNRHSVYPSRLVVGTVQTQNSGMSGDGRMSKFDPHDFSLLVIDESHHSVARSYVKVIDYYRQNPDLKVLGVTATPDRADERALGKIFDSVAYEYGIYDGINDGWLVPIKQKMVHVDSLDYSDIKTTAGDLNLGQLSKVMEEEENLHRVAVPTVELLDDKKTLIFTASLHQAERMVEILNRYKPNSADWVHGQTPKNERRYLFERYDNGEFQYLVNVGVATEGVDIPSMQAVVIARATKSRALFAQMVGRGLRVLPDTVDGLESAGARKDAISQSSKRDLTVLDFAGNSGRHRLISVADILGGDYSDPVVARARKNLEEAEEGDVLSELEQAQREIEEEAHRRFEERLRKGVKARAWYRSESVDPFDILAMCPVRERGWNMGVPLSEKQESLLRKWGVQTEGLTKRHASQIIGRLISDSRKKLCSYKQAALLQSFGYDTTNMSRRDASSLIDQLKENKWKPI